jgi:hypothetical protein
MLYNRACESPRSSALAALRLILGLLKKPDQLQRNLFQRLKPDKLASIRAIDDCYNC